MTRPLSLMERLAWPDAKRMPPAAARALLDIRFQEEDIEQMNLLSAKARGGRLTADEQWELNEYEVVSHLLAIMHLKAKRALKRQRSVS